MAIVQQSYEKSQFYHIPYKINKEVQCGDLVLKQAFQLLDQPTQEALSRLPPQRIASSMNQTRTFADVEENEDELEENELYLKTATLLYYVFL